MLTQMSYRNHNYGVVDEGACVDYHQSKIGARNSFRSEVFDRGGERTVDWRSHEPCAGPICVWSA